MPGEHCEQGQQLTVGCRLIRINENINLRCHFCLCRHEYKAYLLWEYYEQDVPEIDFHVLLMVMMSQSPILQNTVMELKTRNLVSPEQSANECLFTNEAYQEICDQWSNSSTTLTQTLDHFMIDADALGEVMEKYEEGSFSDVADIVIDAIIENSPEGQTFTDVDAHKSTADPDFLRCPPQAKRLVVLFIPVAVSKI